MLGGIATTLLGLAGCGVRLEDDAPDIPFVPTREPIAAEAALLALTRDCAQLAVAAAGVPGTVAAALVGVHEQQQAVLTSALRARGVPASAFTPSVSSGTGGPATSSGTSSGTASPTAPSSSASTRASTSEGLAVLEATVVGTGPPLAGAPAELVPSLVAVLAQRRAAAALLGRPLALPGPATTAPGTGWASADPLLPLISAGRRAAYLFEVVAARTSKGTRTAAVATTRTVRALVHAQEAMAGDATPPPSIGEALPFAVDDALAVRRLARAAVVDLRTAYGAQLPALSGVPDAALGHGAAWLGVVESLARRWGEALQPFPGLR